MDINRLNNKIIIVKDEVKEEIVKLISLSDKFLSVKIITLSELKKKYFFDYTKKTRVFIRDKYNVDYHKRAFSHMCELLDGYINKIVVSFMDEYKNVKNNYSILKYREFTESDYKEIGLSFSASAKEHNMAVQTCYESRNLEEYGFIKGECLSTTLAYIMTGKKYKIWKARNCNCAEMVDIGVYNTCKHFCKYCYANFDEKEVNSNFLNHNVNSSLLIGQIEDYDIIKVRNK